MNPCVWTYITDSDGDRLGDTLAPIDSDPAADRGTDLRGLLADRGRWRTQDYATLGLELHGRTAKGAPSD
jgi:hypothetical protein